MIPAAGTPPTPLENAILHAARAHVRGGRLHLAVLSFEWLGESYAALDR